MGYIEYLQKAIDFIEENIKRQITIDECARVAGFSRYYFYRLFGIYVGTSLMEYVRKRKLSHAMLEVCEGRRILDIALDYGYGSERSFSRAFQQEYGKNPSKFRGFKYSIPSKPVLYELPIKLGGIHMENKYSDVRFETLDTMDVVSAYVISRNPEEEVIEFLTKWAGKNGINRNARNFGFDIPVSEEEQKKGLRGYEYWIKVDESVPTSDGVVVKRIEGCKYVVLRITDPFSEPFDVIPKGWKTLMEWVDSKGYSKICDKERYWLEEVIEKDGSTYMDIYFPIS
jgi:AraC family transcriptional regulator